MAYLCDADDGQPAAIIVTDLSDGTTSAVCGAHMPAYVADLYQQFVAAGVYGDPTEPANPGDPAGQAGPETADAEPVAAVGGPEPTGGDSGPAEDVSGA